MIDPDLKNTLVLASTASNVLNYFRSYTYNFTLSCIPQDAFYEAWDVNKLQTYSTQFVVAKSAGKGLNAISTATVKEFQPLVDAFNQKSPGRFDFFFERLEVDTLFGFDIKSGYSKVNKINFSIVEPYSILGFNEALQTAAVAAGYVNFMTAAFLLTLDFKGYYADPDTSIIPDATQIEPATRYFPIAFSKVDMRVDDGGTVYDCRALPIDEFAFGEPNKLLKDTTIAGNTVDELFKSLENALNNMQQEQTNKVSGNGNTQPCDQYKIIVPLYDEETLEFQLPNSLDEEIKEDQTIRGYKVGEVLKANSEWESTRVYDNNIYGIRGKETQVNPKQAHGFSAGKNIHDIIASILRDSEWCTNLFTKPLAEQLNAYDQLPYFNIGIKAVQQPGKWDAIRNKPVFVYFFYVLPYWMHYSQISGLPNDITIDSNKLRQLSRRTYSYVYTGKNTDVLKLNINYNALFMQSLPIDVGNTDIYKRGSPDQGITSPFNDLKMTSPNSGLTYEQQRNFRKGGDGLFPSPKTIDTKNVLVQNQGPNVLPPTGDPYSLLVKNLHRTLLDNVGARRVSMTILGDPYYLVQSGFGNSVSMYKQTSSKVKTAWQVIGGADYQTGDVYVYLRIGGALDYDKETGIMKLNPVAQFSGLYKILQVHSRFADGVFTQVLDTVMIDGQPDETGSDVIVIPTAVFNSDGTVDATNADAYGAG